MSPTTFYFFTLEVEVARLSNAAGTSSKKKIAFLTVTFPEATRERGGHSTIAFKSLTSHASLSPRTSEVHLTFNDKIVLAYRAKLFLNFTFLCTWAKNCFTCIEIADVIAISKRV
jgi:hypothetical protein